MRELRHGFIAAASRYIFHDSFCYLEAAEAKHIAVGFQEGCKRASACGACCTGRTPAEGWKGKDLHQAGLCKIDTCLSVPSGSCRWACYRAGVHHLCKHVCCSSVFRPITLGPEYCQPFSCTRMGQDTIAHNNLHVYVAAASVCHRAVLSRSQDMFRCCPACFPQQ